MTEINIHEKHSFPRLYFPGEVGIRQFTDPIKSFHECSIRKCGASDDIFEENRMKNYGTLIDMAYFWSDFSIDFTKQCARGIEAKACNTIS